MSGEVISSGARSERVLDSFNTLGERALSWVATHNKGALKHQRKRAILAYHALGTRILDETMTTPIQGSRPFPGFLTCTGTLQRPDGYGFTAQVGEWPDTLQGPLINFDTRLEFRITGYKPDGNPLTGRVYGASTHGAPHAAPYEDGSVKRSQWVEQQPTDIMRLDALLSQMQWGNTTLLEGLPYLDTRLA